MKPQQLKALLEKVRAGDVDVEAAADKLRTMPFERLNDQVHVDHHRELRAGVPEVVLGERKTADQIATILTALAQHGNGALATRVSEDKATAIKTALPHVVHHEVARSLVLEPEQPRGDVGIGSVAVACAGTSDLPVAEEAALTLSFLGHRVDRINDIGVAGLQRLVAHTERLRAANVVIVVAGMEGALPSVVAGMVNRPVIAVPTSVGYGVSLGGYVAMMGMLSSCSPGVMVVNIDNGFGAAVAASMINRRDA